MSDFVSINYVSYTEAQDRLEVLHRADLDLKQELNEINDGVKLFNRLDSQNMEQEKRIGNILEETNQAIVCGSFNKLVEFKSSSSSFVNRSNGNIQEFYYLEKSKVTRYLDVIENEIKELENKIQYLSR